MPFAGAAALAGPGGRIGEERAADGQADEQVRSAAAQRGGMTLFYSDSISLSTTSSGEWHVVAGSGDMNAISCSIPRR